MAAEILASMGRRDEQALHLGGINWLPTLRKELHIGRRQNGEKQSSACILINLQYNG
jgi:hypothetical protein